MDCYDQSPVLKTLILFQTKIYHFSDPFSDLEAVSMSLVNVKKQAK